MLSADVGNLAVRFHATVSGDLQLLLLKVQLVAVVMATSDSSVNQLPHGPCSGGRPPLEQSSVEQVTVTVSSAPVQSAGEVCALQILHKLLLSWDLLVYLRREDTWSVLTKALRAVL